MKPRMSNLLLATSTAALIAAPGLGMALTFGQADINNDGVVTHKEYIEASPVVAEHEFTAYDADQSGDLSGEELRDVAPGDGHKAAEFDDDESMTYERYLSWRTTGSDERFSALDTNGDGELSVAEMANAAPGEDSVRADVDGDGMVTYEEYIVLYPNTSKAYFTDSDMDGDGQLSAAEMADIGPNEPYKKN